MDTIFFRAVLVGLVFGLPVGAVGAMTVERAWSQGFWAGMVTGLGSSAADCLYACVGAFGLTVLSDFLLQYQRPITLLGGLFLLGMGGVTLLGKGKARSSASSGIGGAGLFFSSFFIGITNPAAILTFLVAFSTFGLSAQLSPNQGIQVMLGVFFGTCLWWAALSALTCRIRKKFPAPQMTLLSKVFGTILLIFGTGVLVSLWAGS